MRYPLPTRTMSEVIELAQLAKDNKIEVRFYKTNEGYLTYTSAIELYEDETPAQWYHAIERKLKDAGIMVYAKEYEQLKEFFKTTTNESKRIKKK
jgi:hypothetical protein